MREEPRSRKVFMIVLIAMWKKVYVYAASLVGRKEGRKERNSSGVEKELLQLIA